MEPLVRRYFNKILVIKVAFGLKVERFGIEPIFFQKLLVAPLFDNFPFFNNDNSMSVSDGGKAMRDDD